LIEELYCLLKVDFFYKDSLCQIKCDKYQCKWKWKVLEVLEGQVFLEVLDLVDLVDLVDLGDRSDYGDLQYLSDQ
jgi:tellurite resistance-related uncharacterized protein